MLAIREFTILIGASHTHIYIYLVSHLRFVWVLLISLQLYLVVVTRQEGKSKKFNYVVIFFSNTDLPVISAAIEPDPGVR